ncbi:GNAT family N-acetyltransferase [Pullulanibacillus sp. KACC 23026]|uniref:GNAT family N-acetyltransferase n=1 Tax=Pullulanibacillus sp. KACC 23026 TaxID=3028315 RepID=UPI0023B1D545|nr:GNAT family N-acetyltransferase [Pullulanibacillus sp. KACC 23026]WEG14507.1 GNAT family N-acetyltransferase [Pullulanibacillus sp. KACC 23026]
MSFLWEMLYQSIYVPEGQIRPRREEILKEPNIEKYLKNWGRNHDHALVALDGANQPVGAVWIRLLNHENAGYGFVDDDTPELGMAIMSQYRGQGIGKHLLSEMIDFSRSIGYSALSLSVAPHNKTALQMYEKNGFKKVYQDEGGSWTMKRDL